MRLHLIILVMALLGLMAACDEYDDGGAGSGGGSVIINIQSNNTAPEPEEK